MDNKITYHEQNDIDNTLKLREVLKTLPPFCRDYFRAIDATTTTKTRISYAYDIRIFFQFLTGTKSSCSKTRLCRILQWMFWIRSKLLILRNMKNISKFIRPRTVPKRKQMANVASNEKCPALRSFYAYYYKREMITTNPVCPGRCAQDP